MASGSTGAAPAAGGDPKKEIKKHAKNPYAIPQLTRNREFDDVSTVVWQDVLGTKSPRRDREKAVGLTGAGREGWNCRACGAHNAMLQLYCGVCGGRAPRSNLELQRTAKAGFFRHEGKHLVSVKDGKQVAPVGNAQISKVIREQAVVWCRYGGHNVYFPGKVLLRRAATGGVDVRYFGYGEHGVLKPPPTLKEWDVPLELLRVAIEPPEPRVLHEGQRVDCKPDNVCNYLKAATITRCREDGTYDLLFGGHKWRYAVPRDEMKLGKHEIVRGVACPHGAGAIAEQLRTYSDELVALEERMVASGLAPPEADASRNRLQALQAYRTKRLAERAAQAKEEAYDPANDRRGAGRRRRPKQQPDDGDGGGGRDGGQKEGEGEDEGELAGSAHGTSRNSPAQPQTTSSGQLPLPAVPPADAADIDPGIITFSGRTFKVHGALTDRCDEVQLASWLERASAERLKLTIFEMSSLRERMAEGTFKLQALDFTNVTFETMRERREAERAARECAEGEDGSNGCDGDGDDDEGSDGGDTAADEDMGDDTTGRAPKEGEEALLEIAAGVKTNDSVRSLRLRNCGVGDRTAEKLAEALYCWNTTLTSLDLGQNSMGFVGAAKLAKTISSNKSLLSLRAGGDAHGLHNHTSAIGGEGGSRLLRSLRTNGSLTHIDLGGTPLGDGTSTAAALRHLDENASLTALELMNCRLGDQCAAALAAPLGHDDCLLTSLMLSKNDIGPKGGAALGAVLKRNRTLTKLDLRFNRLGVAATGWLDDEFRLFGQFAGALHHNRTLALLDLSGNNVWSEGAVHLARALAVNCGLQELGLRLNNVGDDGARALAAALGRRRGPSEEDTTLTALDLRNNTVTDDGAVVLAAALRGAPAAVAAEGASTPAAPEAVWAAEGEEGGAGEGAALVRMGWEQGGNTTLTSLHLANNGVALRVRADTVDAVLRRNVDFARRRSHAETLHRVARLWLVELAARWMKKMESGKGMFARKGVWVDFDEEDDDGSGLDSLSGTEDEYEFD